MSFCRSSAGAQENSPVRKRGGNNDHDYLARLVGDRHFSAAPSALEISNDANPALAHRAIFFAPLRGSIRKIFFFSLFIFVLLSALLFNACGKPKPKIPRAVAPTTAALHYDFKLPLAIPAGEKLVYEIKVTRFPIYATAGEITFEYVGTKTQPTIDKLDFKAKPDEQFFHFRASAISRGVLIRLFNISVNDRFETLVAPHKFRTQAVVKEIEENKKHRLQTGFFNYEKREAAYRNTDINNPENPAKDINLKLEDGAMDLLAAFYFVRMQDLPDGATLKFPLLFDAERVEFDLVVHGREELSTDLGKFNTIKVEPKLFGAGRLIAKEGEIFMWLTDDGQRVPVKVTAKTSNATINAELIRK